MRGGALRASIYHWNLLPWIDVRKWRGDRTGVLRPDKGIRLSVKDFEAIVEAYADLVETDPAAFIVGEAS